MTTVATFNCPPCCAPVDVRYLPAWFSTGGLCPGAVDNTQPVEVHATFMLTPRLLYYSGGGFPVYNADLTADCIPQSKSVRMIADDPLNPNRLRFSDPFHIGPGSVLGDPKFLVLSGFIEVGHNFLKPAGSMDNDRIQPVDFLISRCGTTGSYAMLGDGFGSATVNNYASLKLDSRKCAPFSLSFLTEKYYPPPLNGDTHLEGVIKGATDIRGYWGVTFTL